MPEQLGGLQAELIVAGVMAHAGWNIYSPHRDVGIDFFATKKISGSLLIRGVQVRGRYPESKADRTAYGRSDMQLLEMHDEMVLAMPFFEHDTPSAMPLMIAFMPHSQLRLQPDGRYRCHPACMEGGEIQKRRDYAKFFDDEGLRAMESPDWKISGTG